MENIVITAVLVILVGSACGFIWKSKRSGRKCIGCPSGGACSCCKEHSNS